MGSTKKIDGFALVNGLPMCCLGEIDIMNIDQEHRTAYVSWRIFDEREQLLASASRNYFINKEEFSDTDIVEAVLENIMNFRIGRNRIFSEIKIG